METFIETIRAATSADATSEARASGIAACRAIMSALGVNEPIATPREPGPIANAVAALLRTTPPDQLLDMAIAKLRSLVPDDGKAAQPPMFRLQRVEVAQLKRG